VQRAGVEGDEAGVQEVRAMRAMRAMRRTPAATPLPPTTRPSPAGVTRD
jgi:hypothetical protein